MRDILHLSIPAIAIALARVDDPALRQRPVAVAPLHSERALLQCVSAEGRREGLFPGMPASHARRLCPSLKLLPPDPRRLASGYSPLIEPASQGTFFLDLTGCRRLLGPARDAAARLEREISSRLRLPGTVGVAGSKLVSAIASGYLDKPGVCDVLRGAERSFLGPLPVSSLPGIGKQRETTLLQDLNLRTIGELARLPVPRLRLVFGPFAPLLAQRARGVDPSPVRPPKRTEGISEEAFLEQEENDDAVLLAELCRLVEGCGLRLRRLGKSAGELSLRLTYADGLSEQRRQALQPPIDHDLPLCRAAEQLFLAACQRRVRIRGMHLSCGRLSGAGLQLDLFASTAVSPQMASLQNTLDGLRERYGMAAVRWGRALA
jgi:DNA polymerase-4